MGKNGPRKEEQLISSFHSPSTNNKMKSTLLSILSLASMLSTGVLAGNAHNDKICDRHENPDTCTVTVVSEHYGGRDVTTGRSTFVYVLDNQCWSIIDSDDCDDNGLCRAMIDYAPVHLSYTKNDKSYPFTLDEKNKDDILRHPPLFKYDFQGTTGDDYKDSQYDCICAHDDRLTSARIDAQVCKCTVACGITEE